MSALFLLTRTSGYIIALYLPLGAGALYANLMAWVFKANLLG
jgi:hypothetical protein